MTKLTILFALTALLILPSIASAATTADFAEGPGETASAGTWTRVFTVTTDAAGNAESKGAQTVVMNVTSGTFGQMQYRTVKMNKNQTSYQYGDATPLFFGQNSITVGAVTNAEFLNDPDLGRSVKIQFSNDNIGFDSLTVNGVNANPDEVEGSPFLGQSLSASDNFDAGPDVTWQAALPLTTVADGAASQGEQTAVINVTYIPQGGANYRVYKTDASGGDYFAPPTALVLGENSISVPADTFDRAVDVQFSNDAVEFDALTVNGEDMVNDAAPAEGTQGLGQSISESSNIFATTSSSTWVRVATLTTTSNGVAVSGLEQSLVMNVTYIPAGGVNYRVYKTLSGGGNDFGAAQALVLGENTITVPAVSFNRAVKIQFDNVDIEFDALTFNGVDQLSATAEGTQGIGQPFSDFPSIFAANYNVSWYVATMTTPDDGAASQAEQTLVVNVTYIPEGGATFRSNRTNASGTYVSSDTQALVLGENTLTVSAVTFDRTVKAQFSSDAVEFDALTINGQDMLGAEGTQGVGDPISDYANIFEPANTTVVAQGWVSVATLTTAADGAASLGEQTVVINVTYIPSGGVNYRINRTVANGNYNSDSPVALVLGENTITVDAVDYDRTVKLQLSSDAFEFDALTINGADMLDDSGNKITIANSNLFNAGPDGTWVAVLTTSVSQDGASSQNAQTVVMNITTLPAGGANYRVVETVSNGTWYEGDSQPLGLGANTITVNSVAFDRSVKIQFSSDAIEYNALSVNGTARTIGATVTEAPSVSIDGTTLTWDDTVAGTTLQFSDDLESWTSLPSATSPYSPSTTPDRFYRTISE
ncbi:hypothetical protein N9V86_03615 [Opitutales bacterium]|nr:hypothetical protein [Opitutales bacterium]